MNPWVGLLLGGCLGVLHILAARRGRRDLALFLKPLPVLLCLAWVMTAVVAPSPPQGTAWIALGLTLSMVGDVCLGLPEERFLAGLAAFLSAHLCYLAAFLARTSPQGHPGLLLVLAGYSAIVLRLILPHAGPLRGPVLAYLGAIASMVWLAGEAWLAAPTSPNLAAFAGALSFMVSDSLLAVDRFRSPLPARTELVMGTYYLAQLGIAASCRL